MSTPAEIKKLTEQALRGKALMQRSSKSGQRAAKVMDNYENTLNTFDAHIERVNKEDAELNAVLAQMGNVEPALAAAFQSDEPAQAQPKETAGLNKVS